MSFCDGHTFILSSKFPKPLRSCKPFSLMAYIEDVDSRSLMWDIGSLPTSIPVVANPTGFYHDSTSPWTEFALLL
eukprot:jgi/Botrbrau1/11999/Bobra.247_2s0004.1